jgi:uncharacterized Zn-finger protein
MDISQMIAISGGSQDKILLQFRNDQGAREVRIGAREFECIGQTPPQDHPHVYLEMGEQDHVLCPYCGTLFRFDPNLEAFEVRPSESLLQTQLL